MAKGEETLGGIDILGHLRLEQGVGTYHLVRRARPAR